MARILFFVFLAFLVWLAVRVAGARRSRPGAAAPPTAPSTAPSTFPPTSEPILQCAWCGVHVPLGHALTIPDGRVYCGPAHCDAAQAAA